MYTHTFYMFSIEHSRTLYICPPYICMFSIEHSRTYICMFSIEHSRTLYMSSSYRMCSLYNTEQQYIHIECVLYRTL